MIALGLAVMLNQTGYVKHELLQPIEWRQEVQLTPAITVKSIVRLSKRDLRFLVMAYDDARKALIDATGITPKTEVPPLEIRVVNERILSRDGYLPPNPEGRGVPLFGRYFRDDHIIYLDEQYRRVRGPFWPFHEILHYWIDVFDYGRDDEGNRLSDAEEHRIIKPLVSVYENGWCGR